MCLSVSVCVCVYACVSDLLTMLGHGCALRFLCGQHSSASILVWSLIQGQLHRPLAPLNRLTPCEHTSLTSTDPQLAALVHVIISHRGARSILAPHHLSMGRGGCRTFGGSRPLPTLLIYLYLSVSPIHRLKSFQLVKCLCSNWFILLKVEIRLTCVFMAELH